VNALNFLYLYLGVLVAILGLSLGSFGTVLYSRFMNNGSIVFPRRSYCDSCKVQLSWKENIPIFSYLFQKGKCSHCAQPINNIYLKIELLTFLLIISSTIFEHRLPQLLMLVLFSVISPVLIFIDLEIKRIPNKITLAFLVLLTLLNIVSIDLNKSVSQQFQPFFTGLLISIFYLLLSIASKGGMGMGDTKLALPLGFLVAYFSWKQAIASVVFAFFIGAIFGGFQLLFKGKGRKHAIPFAPFMITGAWLAIFGGETLASLVLQFWTIQ
jgi:prepilin signal peptidase PulO-like enzyme (type II secretory pathway)